MGEGSGRDGCRPRSAEGLVPAEGTLGCHLRPVCGPVSGPSCLIAMALKSSKTGSLPVSEIYSFMKEHFPYFKVRALTRVG